MNITIHKTEYKNVTVILNNNRKHISFYGNDMNKQEQLSEE